MEVLAQPVRGSRRRRILLLLGSAMVLLLLAYGGLDLWSAYQLRTQVARLEARYGSLNDDTLRLRPVPVDDNRATIVRAAAALIVPAADPSTIRKFITQETAFPVPPEVRAFSESNRSATSLAAEIRTRSQSNWEIDPRNVDSQPNLMQIRTLSDALHATALLEIEAGRADEASKAVMSGLAVAASLGQELMVVPQLLRIAIGVQQFEAVEEVIVRSEPSKLALTELARWLRENREPDPMRNGLVGEMNFANGVMETMETGTPARLLERPFIRTISPHFRRHIWQLCRSIPSREGRRCTHAKAPDSRCMRSAARAPRRANPRWTGPSRSDGYRKLIVGPTMPNC